MNNFCANLLCAHILDRAKRREKRDYLKYGVKRPEKSKLIMCILCKNEAPIIKQNILFHKAMGVDSFIVTDNDSSDGTRDILEELKKEGIIQEIIDEPGQVYLQDEWCHRMIKLAIDKYKADWVISSDADEFWYSQSLNLKESIYKFKGKSLQYCQWNNFVPFETPGDFLENPYFVRKTLKDFELEKYKLKNKLPHYFFEYNFNLKCIVKARDYVHIGPGNHDSKMKTNLSAMNIDITLFHFFVRDYEHFLDKVKKGGESVVKIKNPNIAPHWKEWYFNYYLKGNLKEYFDEIFTDSKCKQLNDIGVIVKDNSVHDFMQEFVYK